MDTLVIFVTQITLSLLSFGLIARWVIYPRLSNLSLRDALTPLLIFETLRTIGLIFLVPGLADAKLPAGFAVPAEVGDMLAVVLAFIALIAVRAGWRVMPVFVWLFTIEGLADFINATAQGLRFNVTEHNLLGVAWLIPTFGVPAFTVAHVMIIALLLTRGRGRAPRDHSPVKIPERLAASTS